MEPIICPVCETSNASNAEHCEVCGERLTPPAEGEILSPEENVAAFLETSSHDAFEEDSFPEAALEAVSSAEVSEFSEFSEVDTRAVDLSTFPDLLDEESEVAVMALYSPLDGKAYTEGTPEFIEGFGPMGEELVSTPPEISEDLDTSRSTIEAQDSFVETHEPTKIPNEVVESLSEDSYVDASGITGSAQFRAMFKSKEKIRPISEPLPQPGTFVNPASLTVYMNREPVLEYYIETDETLLGRKDPLSDAYPDLDLSDFDSEASISRKHVYVYRQNKNYTLYVVSNAGTQVNNELLGLGDRRRLNSGDVIVLAGCLAIKFDIASS